jgi:chaperonin cofactor prefoldin
VLDRAAFSLDKQRRPTVGKHLISLEKYFGYFSEMNPPTLSSVPSPVKTNLETLCPVIILSALLVIPMACSKSSNNEIKTIETVKAQAAVDAYETTGSAELKVQTDKALAELDSEIRELEIRVDSTSGDKRAEAAAKLASLKTRESEIRTNFNIAKFNVLIQDIKDSVR